MTFRKRIRTSLGIIAITSGMVLPAWGQGAPPTMSPNPGKNIVYPAKGQSAAQQNQDELAAYEWACNQTHWDPYQAQQALANQSASAQQAANSTQGAAVHSAARGALVGVAVGAIAGDAGEGAAIGAAAGGLTGGMRSRRTRQAAASTQQSAQSNYDSQFALWNKYWIAAMEGKGYTVAQ